MISTGRGMPPNVSAAAAAAAPPPPSPDKGTPPVSPPAGAVLPLPPPGAEVEASSVFGACAARAPCASSVSASSCGWLSGAAEGPLAMSPERANCSSSCSCSRCGCEGRHPGTITGAASSSTQPAGVVPPSAPRSRCSRDTSLRRRLRSCVGRASGGLVGGSAFGAMCGTRGMAG
eukprot:364542-Chlamydomonas_euryale.AAC.1